MKKRTAHPRRPPTLSGTAGRLRAILDTAVEAIIVIDDKGVIETFNRAAARLFGYEAREVLGQKINMLMPPAFACHHDEYIARYLKTRRPRIIGIGREVVGMRKDGAIFPMDLAVSEVRSGKGYAFVGIIRDVTERKQMEQALVSVSEGERRIIGQDLHDVLGQQLTGLALLTKALQGQCAGSHCRQTASQVARLAQNAVAEVRRLSHGLYPTELERTGLCSALQELAESQTLLFHVPCRFKGVDNVIGLPRTVELHLYRIAQEAVNNAIKHSRCREIRLRLDTRGGNLSLSIEDDGVGLPSRRTLSQGMGLRIMKHRATLAGIALSMGAGARGGTLIRCCIRNWKNQTTGSENKC